MTGSLRWEGISRSLQSHHLLKRSPRINYSILLKTLSNRVLEPPRMTAPHLFQGTYSSCSRERDFPQSQSMLMVSVHLLPHLCKDVLQEDSLHAFPTDRREADEPAVPCTALLTFLEDWYNVCLSPAVGAPPQSP